MYPNKYDKSFLLYGNEQYIPIIQSAINSLRTFTDLPIIVYLLNSDEKLSGKNVDTKKWICPIRNQEEELYNKNGDENYYIDRNRVAIRRSNLFFKYRLLFRCRFNIITKYRKDI
jgi:hypothetical protein